MARDVHIKASDFNKPVQFQAEQTAPDGSGGQALTGWTTVYKCMAHINTLTDSASSVRRTAIRPFLYMQLYPEADALVAIRYQASIPLTPAMTILYKNRRYQIINLVIPHEELVSIVIPVKLYQVPGTPG